MSDSREARSFCGRTSTPAGGHGFRATLEGWKECPTRAASGNATTWPELARCVETPGYIQYPASTRHNGVDASVRIRGLANQKNHGLSFRETEIDPIQQEAVQKASGGKALAELSAGLLKSIDPDANTKLAAEKFQVPECQEPTNEQVEQVERGQMAAALKPFHDPRLRDAILAAKRSLAQLIDEQTPDQLLDAGFGHSAPSDFASLQAVSAVPWI